MIRSSTVPPRSEPYDRATAARVHWLVRRARGRVLAVGGGRRLVSLLAARRGLQVVPPTATDATDATDVAGVDSVILAEVLVPGEDGRRVLAEAVRVVRPDGVLVVTAPIGCPGDDGAMVFDLASLLDLLGPTTTIESLDISGDHFRVVARPGTTPARDRGRLRTDLQPAFEGALAMSRRTGRSTTTRQLSRLRKVLSHVARHPSQVTSTARSALSGRLPGRVVAERTDHGRQYSAVDLPPATTLPDGPVVRPHLTVAVILDVFSSIGFGYEWNQVPLERDDWLAVVQRVRPDLLFVESVWRGNDGRWGPLVTAAGEPTDELRALVAWCRERGIPTVFWNKEDPAHFHGFVECARLFDQVFTVDADCISSYREQLGHSRVDLLAFAAQPRVHNPVSVRGRRRYPVAFAGTYHAYRHRERIAQMDAVVAPARAFGLHVFTRVMGDLRCQFPPEYAGHVVGSLSYERMLAAYKAYKVFLNVNTVTQSPTMCARRVFELSACSTPVISGYSRALEELFADLVVISRSGPETERALAVILADDDRRDQRGHRAMREVLARHTYGHRVDAVLRSVGLPVDTRRPKVSVIVPTSRPGQVAHALEQVAGQNYRPLQVVVVLRGGDLAPQVVEDKIRDAGLDDVVAVTAGARLPAGACLNLGLDAADGDIVARMDDQSVYGAHFLADLVSAFSFTDAGIVGKAAHYIRDESNGAIALRFGQLEHTVTPVLHPGTVVADGALIRALRFADVDRGAEADLLRRVRAEGASVYSADRFNFIGVRRSLGEDGDNQQVVGFDHRILF